MRESDNWESSIIIITKIIITIITIIIMAQISICSWLRICPQVISCQDDPQHELASFSEETKAKSTSAQKRFLFSKTLMRIRISRSTLRSKFQFLTLSRSPRLNERNSQTHPEILFKFLTEKKENWRMYNFGFLILNSCEIVSLDPQLIVFIASKHETERKKEILILVLKHKIQRTEFKF